MVQAIDMKYNRLQKNNLTPKNAGTQAYQSFDCRKVGIQNSSRSEVFAFNTP